MTARPPFMKARLGSALVLAFTAVAVHAQAPVQVPVQLTTEVDAPTTGERLSDWLLRHPLAASDYLPGTVVELASERPGQSALRSAMLLHLAAEGRDGPPSASKERLTRWFDQLPITGRVFVSRPDARWLQVHPAQDPVLSSQDRIVTVPNPQTVTVLTDEGERCSAPYLLGESAMQYVGVCQTGHGSGVDTVWIVQPDGVIQARGTASWNLEGQDPPAPGAWIWAPRRSAGYSEVVNQQLTQFLATQGAASAEKAQGRLVSVAPAYVPSASLRPAFVSTNDYGGAGLLQMPNARMQPEGNITVSFSREYPYTRDNFIFQPLSWLEAGFRYTSISNQLYGSNIAGGQSYKDKSLDAKVHLLSESTYFPDVSVGSRDVVGTGLFSGEYLVGSKRYDAFDMTLGLGWGSVGARGDLSNPLAFITQKFNTRPSAAANGTGNFSLKNYFRGRTSLFGGVQWQSPWNPLSVKLEYDGNNYRHEPFQQLTQRSPINAAVVYRYNSNVDLTVGVERGNTAMATLSFHGSMPSLGTPKINDPKPVPVAAALPVAAPAWDRTVADIKTQTGWIVIDIRQHGSDLDVLFSNPDAVYWMERLDRVVAVLHRDAPAEVQRFRLIYQEDGLRMAEHVVYRSDWVAPRVALVPPSQQRDPIVLMPPRTPDTDAPVFHEPAPKLETGYGIEYSQSVGGPNNFLLYQIGVAGTAEYHLQPQTWLSGTVQARLIDNYGSFTYDAPSALPRVRTYIREYETTSRVTMPNAQMTHMGQLGSDLYYSLYAGYLESMFGGVGGEMLYRPMGSRLAFGIDANEVKQRDFSQGFGFRNYHVLTGHATMYWDTGIDNVLARVSVGQYLAGDKGVTIDMSRIFHNGVRIGAYATKTNVTAAQFGEGSFDKGIYVSIPFDALLTRSSSYVGNFVWDPLVRDGGAKLNRAYPLYDQTHVRDPRTLDLGPANP